MGKILIDIKNEETEKELRKICFESGVSITDFVNTAISKYIRKVKRMDKAENCNHKMVSVEGKGWVCEKCGTKNID